MPFMKGKFAVRRTLKYLESGKLLLKDRIKIFSINYNTFGEHHQGARDFVYWYLPQIQYKNPEVQVITFKNLTPTPFVKCYFEEGNQLLIDIDSKTKEEVHDHLLKVVGKSEALQLVEKKLKEKIDNVANFGFGCDRHCICEIPGQLSCPGIVPLPLHMRGKTRMLNN
ncbi:probable 28S ribosomal protein S25, mitochondrial [Ctenocephalides felis]|uniref:probable 28S ribosomal protein S25, mitochondrial n=1 Tax=Ctenocephalides felis TaxID=7515 RepID=UPI000E6E4D02|nr:probable 28S ribosomal protein S25, mitochondrial [Ctenocephalides felis]